LQGSSAAFGSSDFVLPDSAVDWSLLAPIAASARGGEVLSSEHPALQKTNTVVPASHRCMVAPLEGISGTTGPRCNSDAHFLLQNLPETGGWLGTAVTVENPGGEVGFFSFLSYW
jgi:hypothetical protein